MKKSNGQIWIDKNPPYNLMYRAGNSNETATDRIVQSLSKYTTTTPESIQVGQLVSLDRGTGNVKSSAFPDDLDNILGVATGVEAGDSGSTVSVATTGEVYISKSLINDLSISKKRILYWNIASGATKPYTQDLPNTDGTIKYINLPVIGYITSFNGYEGDSSYITVQLNMGPFDSVLEFKCTKTVSTKTSDEGAQEIEIKHNLNLGKTGKLRLTVYDEEGNIIPANHTDTSNTAKISIDRSSVGLSLHISGETLY